MLCIIQRNFTIRNNYFDRVLVLLLIFIFVVVDFTALTASVRAKCFPMLKLHISSIQQNFQVHTGALSA